MSFFNGAYQASSSQYHQPTNAPPRAAPPLTTSPDFDILDWHPAYESCQRYFLDHAQHEPGTQALCALINIRLPFQWQANPIHSSAPVSQSSNPSSSTYNLGQWPRATPSPLSRVPGHSHQMPAFVSLIPYIRRLVITGFDKPGILHGFFGDAFQAGVGPLQECERRNYLFAAKHGGWRSCKRQYDMNSEETVPFLKPLQNVRQQELEAAEQSWSSWLAFEDWIEPPGSSQGGESQKGRAAPGPSWSQGVPGFSTGYPHAVSE